MLSGTHNALLVSIGMIRALDIHPKKQKKMKEYQITLEINMTILAFKFNDY
jgi:hypothetical protein